MINILRFIGILFVECSASVISGSNPVALYHRVVNLFHMKPRKSDSLTDMEMGHSLFLIILMAQGEPQITLDEIRQSIDMSDSDFKDALQTCREVGLIGIIDESNDLDAEYVINDKRHQFSILRNNYIHSAEKYPELAVGIYKMLRHVYYVTQCNPAWTFVSLRGDVSFRELILQKTSQNVGTAKGFRSRVIGK